MSIDARIDRPIIVGSILHGAYGDYYNQLVCLKDYLRRHPNHRLILFFASEHRLEEFAVFDLSFAEGVHPWSEAARVPVDRFLQFQVKDRELCEDVLANLPAEVLAKIDTQANHKPWTRMRRIKWNDPGTQIGLSEEGRRRLPGCYQANGLDRADLEETFTVGFLWRYRDRSGPITSRYQPSKARTLRAMSDLFTEMIRRYKVHVLVCGMNLKTTEENRFRIDAKYTEENLGLSLEHCTYLKGLSWGLELEIIRRCSLCLLMPSGFSEALWMKRGGKATAMVAPPPEYLAKLAWNRLSLFDVLRPSEMAFQLLSSHDPNRILRYLSRKKLLPPAPNPGR